MSLPAPRVDVLQRMPLFGALRPDAIEVLLEAARSVAVPAGACFFREREPGSSMFVLETGTASVLKHWDGCEHVLHRLGAGDCFGEMSLMDLGPRSASVRADTDCDAIELGADDLLRLFERDVEQFALVQMNLGREVCRRLRATDAWLERQGLGPLRAAS